MIPKAPFDTMNGPCPMTTSGLPVNRPTASAIIEAECS